jgi:hypothetical protein
MALPEDRKFATFRRGKVRDDIILARFRNSLRGKINPDTGQEFTEEEIAIITQEDSRFFVEADAIDLYGQAIQARGLWLVDQLHPERAASEMLHSLHGRLWAPNGLLVATGGSGPVLAKGTPGTIYVGSTTVGDPSASRARDPAGKRYQVLVTGVAASNGQVTLQMQAIDTGDATNPAAGTVLTWINPPIGTNPQASVTTKFTGGFNQETEFEFAKRITRRIQSKPGSGNNAQFRDWAIQASNAVEDAFVYATALHAGSVIVVPVQKRGETVGPLARIPSVGTLGAVSGYLTPPSSPVVPQGSTHVLVTPPRAVYSSFAMTLSMPKGSPAGWADSNPWPTWSAGFQAGPTINLVNSQTSFQVVTDVLLTASGVNAPKLMLWDRTTSKFFELDVASVTNTTGNNHTIVLNTAPQGLTIATGQVLSPLNRKAVALGNAFQAFFDELGPGELVPATDARYVRAKRYPYAENEYPTHAGQNIISRLDDYLGGAVTGAELKYSSLTNPVVPSEQTIVLGPYMLALGQVGVYPF